MQDRLRIKKLFYSYHFINYKQLNLNPVYSHNKPACLENDLMCFLKRVAKFN